MSFEPFIDKSLIKERTEYAIVFDPNQDQKIEELFNKEVEEPAKQFEFKLDTFQMQAVLCLERHQNVMVAAHTSAGKTVVADYAISMAFRSKSRVIYTSPIKALSNQKYRDFKQEFTDVGLLTGDVQIDTDAKCMIMTTEILLQMLYNKSEVINDLEWVVFDECHYVNDRERGHVWEEVFILLPKSCNLVLLSATVPNVVQFADWLGRARDRPTYVVSTSKRPVPLQHYLYLGRDGKSKNERFLIVDSEGKFSNDNYKEAEEIINVRKGRTGFIRKTPQSERQIYLTLIRHLQEKNELPVICFTLSRNRCDSNLESLMSITEESLKLTTKEEESHIHKFIVHHLSRLKECDKKLPQILKSVAMLKRGFGVHHSGILPILKEITEILFSEGYVKVLVATETFAMGVNMPARSVVFDSIDKHDGHCWRDLKPSEYIQMAGRAGRRGKDKTGTVIILCKYDIPDSPRLCGMMQGKATELESQFRLTYHMICNLHKTCESDQSAIEKFLEQSFGEHHRLKQSLDMKQQLSTLKSKFASFEGIECENCSDIEFFHHFFEEYKKISHKIMPTICMRAQEKKKLSPGTVVAIIGKDNPFEYGIVLKINREKSNDISSLTVLLAKDNNQSEYKTIEINCIHKILNKNLGKKFDSKSIIEENEKNKFKRKDETIDAIEKLKNFNFENDYSILTVDSIDPKKTLQIKEYELVATLDEFISYGQKLLDFKCIKCKDFVTHLESIKKKMSLLNESERLEYRLSTQSLQFLPDYKSRVDVLKYMGYMDDNLVLKLKGKIACLISEYELILIEMLMDNEMGDLEPEQIAALLSAFVCQGSKTNQREENNSTNQTAVTTKTRQNTREFARPITEANTLAMDESPIQTRTPFNDPVLTKKIDDLKQKQIYMNSTENFYKVPQNINPELNFDLLEVVYEWAKGMLFIEVLELTKVQEGIIVRCIQRLDELIKYLKMSAKLMGNKELEDRFESASQVIRRDIVFCQSLYTISDDSSNNKENHNKSDENLSSNFV